MATKLHITRAEGINPRKGAEKAKVAVNPCLDAPTGQLGRPTFANPQSEDNKHCASIISQATEWHLMELA